MGRRHPDAQLQDEERRRKQQLEEIRKREADERNKQEEEQRWREEERAKWEAAEKVKPHCLFFVAFFCFGLFHDGFMVASLENQHTALFIYIVFNFCFNPSV